MDPKGPLVAVITALGISVANSWAGYVVSKRAQTKELNSFMGLVFGSLGIRGIIVVTLAYLCLGVLRMHQVAFALTFSISAFAGLMVEVFFFHFSMERTKRQQLANVKRPFKKKGDELLTGCYALA
ncbi:MAG: hypothetical protein ACK475_06785 [Bacteroidota bacterium]